MGLAHADKVIMKDGKIYVGRVLGESENSVLISNPPRDPKPRVLPLQDVLTVVRETHPEEKMEQDESRFASVAIGTTLSAFSSHEFEFYPAAGLSLGGAFRVFPAMEVGGELGFTPELSHGRLTITDGMTTRGYDRFYAWEGGFLVKLFPFYRRLNWRMEPYIASGFHWVRLVPKASGDALKGNAFQAGGGVLIPWWKPLYWDFRALYQRTNFNSVQFGGGNGDLDGVVLNVFQLHAGLSWRFI